MNGYRPNPALQALFGVLCCTQRIFLQNSACSLNLVFVPFCELLVGERTPDLRTIKSNGFFNLFKWFLPDPNWYVEFDVPFDGIEGPSCLVTQIVHNKLAVALMFRPKNV